MGFVAVLAPPKHPPQRNYHYPNNTICSRYHHRWGQRRYFPTPTKKTTILYCCAWACSSSSFTSSSFSSALTMVPPSMKSNQTTTTISSNSIFSSTSTFSSLFHRSSSELLSRHLVFHHLTEPIHSTQDEARKLLSHHYATHGTNKAMAVLADIQLHGRGTQGRKWERGQPSLPPQQQQPETTIPISNNNNDDEITTSTLIPAVTRDGNMYLTMCIPFDRVPVFITLLPLQIGVLVAERLHRIVQACSDATMDGTQQQQQQQQQRIVTVKWPNDVLIRDHKISGTLIENAWIDGTNDNTTHGSSWLLIGVGINVASAPYDLSNSPGKQVRSAICLQNVCQEHRLPESTAWILGRDIASALADWVYEDDHDNDKNGEQDSSTSNHKKVERGRKVIENWLQYAEFHKTYELRGRVVDEEQGGYQGERVITLGIQDDGQLRVQGADGRERLLVADYLF